MHPNVRYSPKNVLGHVITVCALILAFVCVSGTPARAESFPDGYPRMGHSSEAVSGYSVSFAGRDGSARTNLFPVYTAPGSTPNQFAYCIELTVSSRYDSNLNVGGWDTFPGNNRFRTDQKVREQVAWIVYNSYPNKSLEDLRAASGVSGLTAKDAITATQSAIWSLTDTSALAKVKDVDQATETRVKALFAYLVGPANVGRPEVLEPTLNVKATGASGTIGSRVGPITIESSEDTIAVTTDSPYPVVDTDGRTIDLNKVPGNTQLFIDVPSDATPSSASLSVELKGSRYTGLLVTNVTDTTHYQTLMISASDEVKVNATAQVSWADVPALTTQAHDAADSDKLLAQDGNSTIVDTVNYTGLTPGKQYTVSGELMIREDGSATPTGIVASTSFTPTQSSGSVEVEFAIPDNTLNGATIVVFERLFLGDSVVAEHTDIDDENQTVYRPDLETDAWDILDEDHFLAHSGGTIRDTLTYSGLLPHVEYAVEGVLMNKESGESTGITARTEFTPRKAAGTISLDFEVPSGFAGSTLVAFERIHLAAAPDAASDHAASDHAAGDDATSVKAMDEALTLVAQHTDLNDARQTVTVDLVIPPTEEPTEEPTDEPSQEPSPQPTPTTPANHDSDEEPVTPAPSPSSDVLGEVIEPADEVTVDEDTTHNDLAATGSDAFVIGGLGLALMVGGTLMVALRKRKSSRH